MRIHCVIVNKQPHIGQFVGSPAFRPKRTYRTKPEKGCVSSPLRAPSPFTLCVFPSTYSLQGGTVPDIYSKTDMSYYSRAESGVLYRDMSVLPSYRGSFWAVLGGTRSGYWLLMCT